MAVDWPNNFWAKQFSTPTPAENPTNTPTPVIEQVGEDGEPIPYHHLPGSGTDPSANVVGQSAKTLFPWLDGKTVLLAGDKPAGFDLDPEDLSPAVFADWHTAHQLEYLYAQFPLAVPDPPALVIGSGDTAITVVASEEPLKVYFVEKLQKADIARMSAVDQTRVMATAAFAGVASALKMTTDDVAVLGIIGALESKIEGTVDANGTNQMVTRLPDGSLRDDRTIFLDQLQILRDQINGMKIFSETDIANQIKEIEARFDRAAAFAGEWYEGVMTFPADAEDGVNYPTGVVDLEGNESIKRAYRLFVEQENQILRLKTERMNIATSAGVDGKALDVPTLVFMLQLNYNLDKQAKITIDTEEVNQTNLLLKTYAAMQDIMNVTLKQYDPSNQNDTKTIRVTDANGANPATTGTGAIAYARVLAMFEDPIGRVVRHPLEVLKDIQRPVHDFFHNINNTLEADKKSEMDLFNGQLQDRVTLINQESQIKMNNINSMDKEKNRHFDLANNALAKMAEMLQTIARAT